MSSFSSDRLVINWIDRKPRFSSTHDKMFMIEGVVLNVPSAMQEARDGFPPVTLFPRGTEEAPSPRRGFFFWLSGARWRAGPDGAGKSEARPLGRASPVSGLRFSLSYARISCER